MCLHVPFNIKNIISLVQLFTVKTITSTIYCFFFVFFTFYHYSYKCIIFACFFYLLTFADSARVMPVQNLSLRISQSSQYLPLSSLLAHLLRVASTSVWLKYELRLKQMITCTKYRCVNVLFTYNRCKTYSWQKVIIIHSEM